MDVSYINPFITATTHAFKTMMNTEVHQGSPQLKKMPFPMYDVSGVIGLSGDAQGSVSLSFPMNVATKVVSKMLGTPIIENSDDMIDGIGELTNIVAGNAKGGLTQFKLSISLPNVIIGKDHIITEQRGCPTILLPFSSSLGAFAMEISLKTP